MNKTNIVRESRKFYYVGESYVSETIGYICPQENYWWCPSVGYSAAYGVSLFDTKEEALDSLIEVLHDKLDDIENTLIKVQKERDSL